MFEARVLLMGQAEMTPNGTYKQKTFSSGGMVKYFLVVILTPMFFVGCASHDIRNWDSEKKTGQIVVFTGENWLVPPTVKDARDDLMESGHVLMGMSSRN